MVLTDFSGVLLIRMANVPPTESERVFTEICLGQSLSIHKIPEVSHKKTPDFKVSDGNFDIFAEVKQHESELAKEAKEWNDNHPNQIRIGNVDFHATGRMDRILRKQKKQLSDANSKGLPTLAVIYPKEVMGPTDYECQMQLENGLLEIPEEISAVMYMENENVEYLEAKPSYQVFLNPKSAVQFPKNFFN